VPFWHITQPHTKWEVHFSRPSSAIQHAILSQSVQLLKRRKKTAANSLVFESQMWRSTFQEPVKFFFVPTDNFLLYQGQNRTEIQAVQFRNRHFCKKGRIRLRFGITKCEAKQLWTFTSQDPVRILNRQLSAWYDVPSTAVT